MQSQLAIKQIVLHYRSRKEIIRLKDASQGTVTSNYGNPLFNAVYELGSCCFALGQIEIALVLPCSHIFRLPVELWRF